MVSTTDNDTICAVSTPHGVGGIAVIRISGPKAIEVTSALWKGKNLQNVPSHTAHLGIVKDHEGEFLDQAVATVFRAPHSFTGEDVVELSVHGSLYVQQRLVDALCHSGARLAEAGEFTRRAFVSGKMDLVEAEGIADMLAARTQAAHRLAASQMRGGMSECINGLRNRLIELASLLELELDFSEEDVEFAPRAELAEKAQTIVDEVTRLLDTYNAGNAIRNGIPVAIVGNTNAGKSSLLNAILNEDRAIVSNIHGTTRDVVEDTITLNGLTFRLLDTAGFRTTDDPIEQLGIARSQKAIDTASIILHVQSPDTSATPSILPPQENTPTPTTTVSSQSIPNDISAQPIPSDISSQPIPGEISSQTIPSDKTVIIVHNKSDLTPNNLKHPTTGTHFPEITISAKTGQGIPALIDLLTAHGRRLTEIQGDIAITNLRHKESLTAAKTSALQVLQAIETGLPTVLTAQHLRDTISHLSRLTGAITDQTLLTTIFTRFCVGK
ncbi:MAG: tRNA uridine-5-carboxymethylaminomethyl(34) synthesis GTPase MnmE [Bacteroidales bacterium]|nr:tRNA uridine-5-carboxymethylaminomethyl(34) synthesis GTPase MnmE [Bacteroidales bacterium]